MSKYEGKLLISDEMKAKAEEWGVREEDIRTCIGTAEETGEYMRDENAENFLAKVKIDETYIVAQFQKSEDGYILTDVYSHRTEVTGW